jgi:hypothetical protein
MSYNAFQGQYQKSTKALTMNASFTWSKNINVGCADYWEGCNIQDPYHMSTNRSADDVDVPIVASASAVYELPFGKGKAYASQGGAAYLLGGWKVNGLLATRGGTVFTPSVTDDNSNSNGASLRPNVSGSTKGSKTLSEWFNTGAFSEPANYTYGTAGRNCLRGPAYTNLDMSLFRQFKFTERYVFEFRTEVFDLLNHQNFGNPGAQLGQPNFGVITSTSGFPRRLQFAGTFRF